MNASMKIPRHFLSLIAILLLPVATMSCESSGSDSEVQRPNGQQAGSWHASSANAVDGGCPEHINTLMDFLEEPWNGLVAGTIVEVEPVLDRYNLMDGTMRAFDEPRTCPMSMSPALRIHLSDVLTSWGESDSSLVLHAPENYVSTWALRPRVPADSTDVLWEEAHGTNVRNEVLPPGPGLRVVLGVQPLEGGELFITGTIAMEINDENRLNVVDIMSCLETDADGQDFQNWFGSVVNHLDGRVPEVVDRPFPVQLGSECDAITR